MIDLKGDSERLKNMKGSRKTPAAVDFVHDMLASKFERLRSLAIQVLGSWGQKDDKALIIDYLLQTYVDHPDFTYIRIIAISAVEPLIEAEDTSWLLDLCFKQETWVNRHYLFRLFRRLDLKKTRTYLLKKLKSESGLDRWSAVRAIMAIGFLDQKKLLEPLLCDSEDNVRQTAANGIAQAELSRP